MKKLLLALIVGCGALTFAPQAQAGNYGYHDRYRERPVYRSTYRAPRQRVVVYRTTRVRHYDPYCAPRPVYYAPRPVYYAPRPVYYSSRPRLSFHIGF